MSDTPEPLDVIYVFAGMAEAMRRKPKTVESRAYVPKDDYDELVAERDALKAENENLLEHLEMVRLECALEELAEELNDIVEESWPTRSRRYRATLARIAWTLLMCGVVAAILTVVAAVAVGLTVTL